MIKKHKQNKTKHQTKQREEDTEFTWKIIQKNDVKDDPKISKQNGITDNRLEAKIEKRQGMFNKNLEK